MNRHQLKILKKLDTLNFNAKNIFDRYYLRYNGEASSSMGDLKELCSLKYIVHEEDFLDVYEMLGVEITDVLYVDSYATAKALDKRTKIEEILILDGRVIIISSDKNLEVIAETMGWLAEDGLVHVPIMRITDNSKCGTIFDTVRVDTTPLEMHNITHLVGGILSKFRVTINVDGESIYVGKPLFPTLNKHCTMFAKMYSGESENLAHVCVKKEDVLVYHIFVSFPI